MDDSFNRLKKEQQEITLEEIKKDYEKWVIFLDEIIGLFTIGAAFSAYTSPHPAIFSFITLLVTIGIAMRNKKYFPQILINLRAKTLFENKEEEKIYTELKEYIEKELFGKLQTYLKAPVFVISYSLLAILIIVYGSQDIMFIGEKVAEFFN